MIQGQDSITREERMDRLNEPGIADVFIFNQKFHLHSRGWKERFGSWISPYTGNVLELSEALDVEQNMPALNRAIECVTKLKSR